jgi:hypothetical protein
MSPQIIIPTYVSSPVYNQIVRILVQKKPNHAWVRFFGYRLIEEVGLVVDGEQFDLQDSDLMLQIHKMIDPIEHERGDNIMLGHIPEMYEISNTPKPAMRLYIQFFLFFGKEYGNSLPLVNMLYSDIRLKLKLRNLDELLYLERGAQLAKPIKIKSQLLGNFIYLGDEERRTCATTKTEAIMERYVSSGTFIRGASDLIPSMLKNDGYAYNVLKFRYHFDDPCKYLLWKIQVEYPDTHDSDKIHWDLSDYRVRHMLDGSVGSNAFQIGMINTSSKVIEVAKRILIEFNSKTREHWKEMSYYRLVQPYNKCMNSLDFGEGLYAMCLFPKLLQPTGATNLTYLEEIVFYMEIDDVIVNLMKTTGLKIKVIMWSCSYNILAAFSGFGALRFYAAK